MNEHYYLVEVPGPKEHKAQVIKADEVKVNEAGCLCLYQSTEHSPGDIPLISSLCYTLIAAFAPGRWITCKLGVMKSPDAERLPEAAPDV